MDAEVESQYDKNNPFLAKLTEYSPLYKEGSSKDTRHFVVDLTGSNLVYTCGDSLGVYPSNQSEDVDTILKALGASGDESITLPRTDCPISFREALISKLSLALPTRNSLLAFANRVEAEEEKTQLGEPLNDDMGGLSEANESPELTIL